MDSVGLATESGGEMRIDRRTALKLLTAGAASATTCVPRNCLAISRLPGAPTHARYKDASLPIEQRVQDLLARMTLEEKARQIDMYAALSDRVQPLADWDAQFLADNHSALKLSPPAAQQPDIPGDAVVATPAHLAAAEKLWGSLGVGAVHALYPTTELANSIQQWAIANTRLGIPILFVEEGLHGYHDGTIFPAPINLASTWNRSLAKRTGAAIAAEARANGIGMVLAPVLDVARDPRWGRVEEDFGEDPYLSGQMGLAYVKGAQGTSLATDHTLVTGIKHFAGYGASAGGTNTSPTSAGERELRSVLLKSMEPAIREGRAMSVMASYNDVDDLPVVADHHLLTDILRKEWGFNGFVLSDLGAIRHLYDRHFTAATPKDAICRAINAGVDMQFYDFDHETFQNAIRDGIADGTLTKQSLDRAVASVLRVKFLLGLFDRPAVPISLEATVRRSQAHLDLSLESARQSMTLLQNEGNLLPLPHTLKTIAVVGPNASVANYGDYSDETQGARISPLAGIKALLPHLEIIFDDGSDIPRAVAKSSSAEVILLCLGETQGISGEGFDRSNLDLPGNQQPLLAAIHATGKPIVLVLQNGRPLTLSWAKQHVPAILEAWYPGEFGGRAIAETLFGLNNPAGRLSITFPQCVGQLPDFYNFEPSKKTKYTDNDGEPLFHFGFGLSYSTFQYSRLIVHAPTDQSKSSSEINVEVTNTSDRAGDEVVQLYFREDVTSVETPIRQLADFARITLAPHETQSIPLQLKRDQLSIWNEDARWVQEPGWITIWAGGSSQATLQSRFPLK